MVNSPAAELIRGKLRRTTAGLALTAALLVALDLLLLPLPAAGVLRWLAVLGAAVVDAGAVLLLGELVFRRPLLPAIEALELHARAAETQRLHADRLASGRRSSRRSAASPTARARCRWPAGPTYGSSNGWRRTPPPRW